MLALRFIVSWQEIRRNIVFILIMFACTAPYLPLACVNYEFPAPRWRSNRPGISVVTARAGIGLTRYRNKNREKVIPFRAGYQSDDPRPCC